MDRKTRWRTFWLGLLIALATCVLIPSVVPSSNLPLWFSRIFNKKMQFGLDLQGGLYIVYSLDLDKSVDDKASELKRDIEAELEEKGIKARVTTPAVPVGAVTIVLEDAAADKARIDSAFLSSYEETEVIECPAEQVATSVCLQVRSNYAEGIRDTALEQAILTIRDRIDERGIAEPSVKRKGTQIVVELPGLDEQRVNEVKEIIARTAKLEFKMVDNNAAFMSKLYNKVQGGGEGEGAGDPRAAALGITGAIDVWNNDEQGGQFQDYYLRASDEEQWFTVAEARKRGCFSPNKPEVGGKMTCTVSGRERIESYLQELAAADPSFKLDDEHVIGYEQVRPDTLVDEDVTKEFWRTYFLFRPVELSGSAITEAYVYWDPQTNRPAVLVDFNRYGGRRFGEMTSKNVGKKMAIILDDRVISAPTIQQAITGGRSTITMGGGSNDVILREAEQLVAGLKTGSLPAPLQEESSAVIGPLLGRDAVDKAQFAFGLGSVLVVLIMIWIYRFSGVIAVGALVLNLFFMLAILAAFQATLTLPGIAALVLTVGMAVDANIIIYERIRDELRSGKSIRGSVDAGFSRAFGAIFDGQITTAVAGYVLMQYGSGPIVGFAVMLIIGIVCTLFTTTWCTRLFFDHYLGKGRKVTQISI